MADRRGSLDPSRRVVLVRVTGFRSKGSKIKYTSYEIEFRFNDNKKMRLEKRYRDFRTLWQHAAKENEDVKDFDFPIKTKTVNDLVKENRLRKFDELMKLCLALSPGALQKWIDSAQENDADISAEAEKPADKAEEADEEGVEHGEEDVEDPAECSDGEENIRETLDMGRRLTALVDQKKSTQLVGDGKDVDRLQKRVFQLETACRDAMHDLQLARERQQSEEAMFRRLQAASDLTIEIPDAEAEYDDHMQKRHMKYRIVISSEADHTLHVEVRRRFSEFLHLHGKLCTTIEPPAKTYFFNSGDAFIEARRQELEKFLEKIVDLYSVLHVDFLRTFLGLNDELSVIAPMNAKSARPGASIAAYQSFDASSMLLGQRSTSNTSNDDWLTQRSSVLMDPAKRSKSQSGDGEFWSNVKGQGAPR